MISIIFKLIAVISEGFLGIPFFGGAIIVTFLWIPLIIMFFVHVLGVIFANIEGKSTTGHLLGIIASLLGFIPFLGWVLHCVTFIVLLTEMINESRNKNKQNSHYSNSNQNTNEYHNQSEVEVLPRNFNQNNSDKSNKNANYPVILKQNSNKPELIEHIDENKKK